MINNYIFATYTEWITLYNVSIQRLRRELLMYSQNIHF
jgi:hypothetical protein